MSTNLDNVVPDMLGLLNARRGDWQAVASASGVSYSWLSKFANGHIDNPGLETLKKLRLALDISQAAPAPELIGIEGAPEVPATEWQVA